MKTEGKKTTGTKAKEHNTEKKMRFLGRSSERPKGKKTTERKAKELNTEKEMRFSGRSSERPMIRTGSRDKVNAWTFLVQMMSYMHL